MSDSPPAPTEERPEITRAPATAFVIGLFGGMLSVFLGVGSGLLMMPALIAMLRIRPHRATGTALAATLPTALVAAFSYHQEALARHLPSIDAGAVAWLAIGEIGGALVGAKVLAVSGARSFRWAFGFLVVAAGMLMIARLTPTPPPPGPFQDTGAVMATVGIGVLVGAVSALLGIGGGLVMVPALVLLLGYPQYQAQGTSLAVIVPVSVSGALIHLLRGNVIRRLVTWLAAGAVIGVLIVGPRVFTVHPGLLRTCFGIFLIMVGVFLVGSRRARETSAGATD